MNNEFSEKENLGVRTQDYLKSDKNKKIGLSKHYQFNQAKERNASLEDVG